MGTITIHPDKDQIIDDIQGKLNQLQDKAQDMIIDVSDLFMSIARVLAPYLTGELRDSIQVFLGSSLEATIESLLNYFEYVILGTSEHDIGSPIWIPQVADWRYIGLSPAGRGKPHPGTKANDFMEDAMAEGENEAEHRIDNFMEWLAS